MGSHQPLAVNASMGSPDPDRGPHPRSGPGMAERAGLMPLIGAVPALFRHQNRDSSDPAERGFARLAGRKLPSQWSPGMTSSDVLPPPPTMPLTAEHDAQQQHQQQQPQQRPPPSPSQPRNPFETRDSLAFFSSSTDHSGSDRHSGIIHDDIDPSYAPPADVHHDSHHPHDLLGLPPSHRLDQHETMTMSPGPRRQPTIHRGGPYFLGDGDGGSLDPSTAMAEHGWDDGHGHRRRESRFAEVHDGDI